MKFSLDSGHWTNLRAYLDIETTFDGQISLVGIHVPGREIVQLTGHQVTDIKLAEALQGIETVVTFNGAAFDLPVIRRVTGLDILDITEHRDLLSVCRKRGIKGGLKRVEVLFGIQRVSDVVDGTHAPRLWYLWETYGDKEALDRLQAYNREDCVNLEILENILDGME